jgi:hypothetical protein
MERFDDTTAALLPQAAPSTVQLTWNGKESVEAAAPSEWLVEFVLAVARQKWAAHRGLSERWFNDAAMKHLARELHGAPLGRWSFETPRGFGDPLDGDALLKAVEAGVPFADGLRWDQIRGVEVWNESEHAANIALWVMGDLLVAGGIVALAVVAAPAVVALGAMRGSPIPLPKGAMPGPRLEIGDAPDGARVVPSTGDMLWTPAFLLPDIAGARPLLAKPR